mgnify:CR=1 FL=1
MTHIYQPEVLPFTKEYETLILPIVHSSNHQSTQTLILRQNQLHLNGNIWQAEFDKLIVTPTGRPANPAIKLLNEIIAWYIPKKDGSKKFAGEVFTTSQKYLTSKLSVSEVTIRRNLSFLEKEGWIQREVRHEIIYNKLKRNVIAIHLTTKTISFLLSISSSRVAKNKTTKNNLLPAQICTDNTNTKKDNKINSYEKANFEKNNLENIKSQKSSDTNTKNNKFEKIILTEELALQEQDYDYLRMHSGRTFCNQAIDEILKDLVRKSQTSKIQAKEFYCKQAFLKFFAGWLAREMRQEAKVNLVGFKIMPRRSKEEKEAERYLTEVESRQDDFAETKFRKCIASSFVNTKAWEILTKLGNINIAEEKVKLEFTEFINLTEAEQQTIEKLARQHFITEYIPRGSSIGKLIGDALIKNMDRELYRELGLVEDEDTVGENTEQDVIMVIPKDIKQKTTQLKVGEMTIDDEKWRAVYEKLVLTYGEDVAKSWFMPHKILGKFDDAKMEVTIEASTGFIRDWVDTHYGRTIENIITNLYGKHDVNYVKTVQNML